MYAPSWWEASDDSGTLRKDMTPKQLAEAYGNGSRHTWQKRRERYLKGEGGTANKSHRSSVTVNRDGSTVSDRLIEMSAGQSKDPAYLLTAHGFDPSAWTLRCARNSMWQQGGQDCQTLYASRIEAAPIVDELTFADFVEAMRGVQAVKVARGRGGEGMLELGHTDMHFGSSTLDYYRTTLERTVALVQSQKWAEVVIPLGSDLFHADNFKSTTSNGTQLSSVDWPQAWADALAFYATVIEAALKAARAVHVYYIPGNHDESMSWAFCQMLAVRYPQARFCDLIAERKVHTFGEVCVGMTHGDGKTRRDLDRVFLAEFREFASATVREVHAGHYHHETTADRFGVVVRSLSSGTRTDKWHREEGYVGAVKRFMCFAWGSDALRAIHYV